MVVLLRPLVMVFGLMTAFFSGCIAAQSGQPAGANGPEVSSGPAAFDETTGGIEGTVTDTELAPIANALIGILKDSTLPADITVSSDAAGHFSMSHVAPGEHVIQASALGFQANGKRITVAAGAVTQASVVLEKVATQVPYSWTDIRKAAVSAVMYKASQPCNYSLTSVNNLAKTCGGARTGCDPSANCEVHYTDRFAKNSSVETILMEVTWQPQTGVSGKAFAVDLNAPNVTRNSGGSINQQDKYTFFKMTGKAPVIIRIDIPQTLQERQIPESDWYSYEGGTGCTAPSGGASNCDWFFRIFGGWCDLGGSTVGNCDTLPVDYGLSNGNVETTYITGFFMQQAPAGFTALPDR